MSSLTPEQQRAVDVEGNVLLIAGAGTGKTRTLVERCLTRVCRQHQPVGLNEVLMVTFTEAAAAEMRQRLRDALDLRLAANPQEAWLSEQRSQLDTARISTLHSFCLELVREHFYELGLDPQVSVLADDQSRLLAHRTLDDLLRQHYASEAPRSEAVRQLVLDYGRGWDEPLRQLILRVHHYAYSLADPLGWFERESHRYAQPNPALWERWLRDGFNDWRTLWIPQLTTQPGENTPAHRAAQLLAAAPPAPTRSDIAALASTLVGLREEWPTGTKSRLAPRVQGFFEDAAFLQTVASTALDPDPLRQDWDWTRTPMTVLLGLVHQFGSAYARAKREAGGLDFQDLEQFALALLWDRPAQSPTPIALQWRKRLRLVFVDEYQDINQAQDTLLRALAREGEEANRFLVGDIKQSIYRFRLADPRIFQGYARDWETGTRQGQALPLAENFRSHPSIVEFVNQCFSVLMRPVLGGVDYASHPWLRAARSSPAVAPTPNPQPPVSQVEFHVIVEGLSAQDEPEDTESESATSGLNKIEREAVLVAETLTRIKQNGNPVWDRASGAFRPPAWHDMAVLLRSPRGRTDTYARAFEQAGIPLTIARGGFYDSLEISDLVSLLRLIDNPIQDIPLLAVLRSPMVALTPNQLAEVRMARRAGPLWFALTLYHEGKSNTPGWESVDRFIRAFRSWRRRARDLSLSECLEAILEESGYAMWLLSQPRGTQATANVNRLLTLTRQFDPYQRHGLHRFLEHLDAQAELGFDAEPAQTHSIDAVELMSIHQSKGLEFPIVVVAELGKQFNLSDLSQGILLDEEYGICPQIQPPGARRRYPSLPHWLAQRRQRRESLGEELRLLYVATTRACDRLVLVGSARRRSMERWWHPDTPPPSGDYPLLGARSCMDWLIPWAAQADPNADWTQTRSNPWFQWTLHDATSIRTPHSATAPHTNTSPQGSPPRWLIRDSEFAVLRSQLTESYPHTTATRTPAKVSVTGLRRQWHDSDVRESESLAVASGKPDPGPSPGDELTALDFGLAHHRFLQLIALDREPEESSLRQELIRMQSENLLSTEEARHIDLPAVAAFWRSDIGGRVYQQRQHLHRELPFTCRMTADDLRALGMPAPPDLPEDDFLIVQGVVDLAVIRKHEIWVLDFKSDRVSSDRLAEPLARHTPQIRLYARALAQAYRRPVTEAWIYFLRARQATAVPGLTDIARFPS